MSNRRLSEDLRREIRGSVMKGAFQAEAAKATEAQKALALRIYRHFISEKIEQAALQAPSEFRYMSESFAIKTYGDDPNDYGRRVTLELPAERPLPVRLFQYGELGSLSKLKPQEFRLIEAIERANKNEAEVEQKRTELRDKVNGVLCSVTTVKRLLQVWPEVKPHIPAWALEDPKPNLPAVEVGDVMKSLKKAGVELEAA